MNGCALQAVDHRFGTSDVEGPDLDALARAWESLSATQRVECALDHLPGAHLLSSSFGMQAAVMLHLVARVEPGIPVVFVDTGYHFPETYRFVDDLADRLGLNLKVYRARLSPAWQEARFGKRWEQGREGIQAYNRQNKVEPMQRALDELGAGTWFSGLRRSQAETRQSIRLIEHQWSRLKIHPIADWTDRDVHRYLDRHDLPYHPLREQGYLSIGDWHTTRSIHEVDEHDQLRFFGLARECGLHEPRDTIGNP
ncbi:MAG: phosphoadenylyl-sulfate reductase [Wenzhouxiangellaceae bacterium]|nr:phosphoadenylyl-sulfate reductase [Wenzhouxiangellaceae bacterium]